MSPDRMDIVIGTIIFLLLEVVMPIVFFLSSISILIPFIVLPVPAIVVGLAIYRLIKGHKVSCSIRWGYYAVAGTARFLSF